MFFLQFRTATRLKTNQYLISQVFSTVYQNYSSEAHNILSSQSTRNNLLTLTSNILDIITELIFKLFFRLTIC